MNDNINKTTLPTPGTAGDLMALMVAYLELEAAVENAKKKESRQ